MAAAVVAGAWPGSAGAQADLERRLDRFELFTNCEAVDLVVSVQDDEDDLSGLREEAVTRAARSRLRSARLFSESGESRVSVYVHIVGLAYRVELQLWKRVFDPLTAYSFHASTWRASSTGTHGMDAAYVVSAVQRHMDTFLDEYLRINESACTGT